MQPHAQSQPQWPIQPQAQPQCPMQPQAQPQPQLLMQQPQPQP
jgi:hypothetical protein